MSEEQAQVVVLTDFWIRLALFCISAVISVIYTGYMLQTIRDWRDYADVRALRALVVSVVLAIGMWSITLNTISTVFFVDDMFIRDLLTFARAVLYGMIIVGGIFLLYTRVRKIGPV